MQKCSARAAVTPSGSRSDERRMHAQRGGHAFRSGQRNHFAIICLVPDFCAPRPSVLAAGFLHAVPHAAAPPCVLIPSIRLLWSCERYGSSNHGDGLIFPPQASNKKTPPRGPTARRGIVSPRRKRGSPSTRPTWGMLSSKGVAVGSIRDSGTRKSSTAPCPPRCRTSDNLVVFIRCPFTPESGQIADISGGLLCAKSGHWPDYSITSSARVRNDSEMVNPIVAAVLRFTISSNLVGN